MNGTQTRTPKRASSMHSNTITSNTTKSSFSYRRSEKRPNLISATIARAPRSWRQSIVVQVVDIEQTSVSEHGRDDEEKENPVYSKPGEAMESSGPSLQFTDGGGGLSDQIQRLGVCAYILALTIAFILVTCNFIELFDEVQILIVSILPVLANWVRKFASLRRWRILQRLVGLAIRLSVVYWVLTTVPLTGSGLIFQHHRGVLPVATVVTALTLLLHFLIRPSVSPDEQDLAAPDFESRIPVGELRTPQQIRRLETRLSMLTVYFGQVLVLPLMQEVIYRGVIVGSFGFFYRSHIAAAIGALCYNCSQSYKSTRTHFSRFLCGVLWGVLFLLTDGNLMYPFVAHIMHNAVLFGVYHFDTITDCF